ncbi:hypothetical protein M440DRAFT_1111954 [Trichoderma longibrachiatum ATCC 18648]|uniref:Uncharacterized protein n=1 Tax=Trichoderma longibrachiatum ATCC 18648 TaxID=983965 RepID=A0A2T4CEW4_TRILO|nr:hypothetical protein M440DRAFT_1111954 [Trichoderma longibrachiatum ATCC 18648]
MISSSIHLASSPSHSRSSNPPARWLRCSIRRDAHSLSESRLPTSLGSLFGAEAGATRRSSSTTPTSAGLYYCSGPPGFEAAKLLLSALWRSVHQLRDAYSRRIKRVTRGGRALRRDRCRTTCFRAVSACMKTMRGGTKNLTLQSPFITLQQDMRKSFVAGMDIMDIMEHQPSESTSWA